MMKRNILAVVIPALLAAGAANAAEVYNKDGNKLDLYGKAVGLHYFSKNNGQNAYAGNGDQTYGRLGFKGQTQINDQLTGYGQWEYQFNFNNSEGSDAQTGNKTRLGFAGLKYGDYGSIDYGRNYAVVYDALGWTDMLPEFGGDTAYTDIGVNGGRTTGVLTYRNTNFFNLVKGWDFALQYQGKNERSDIRRANGDGWGASTSYTSDIGVGIVGAYGQNNRTSAQTASEYGRGSKAERWATALKYDANNVYLAAMYSQGRNALPITVSTTNDLGQTVSTDGYAKKSQTIELVAQYQFDFGLRPSLAYVQTKGKDIEGIGDADLVKYYEVGATYYFNKNMSTYVDYIINQIDKNNKLGLGYDDTVAVGLVYQF
ncbi:porin OmpC [Erwinia sp. OLTSP20]|uniref:porin OmpF n=1 Tax=unclassified Erwinia TaxID=2622719 RepID=UPI000C183E8E|nr:MULTISPECIES: porin OmpF [unclassified Erwinia]PIJ51338.1 porin OmpC [Erwinia sp. OAMSP11]PIJ74122.1 porin OmpC [Erwinia sp. OLSSP12]PIJ79781.1 porin OmpC [Erwinia sp. OLCASP19]PIJ86085.1 porin OmpC [Erwinia sp. OLMTSP26]PIJ87834.1 porin OmpC [Erwinia sp. OLMDSP33]